jgi:hypothetical protein
LHARWVAEALYRMWLSNVSLATWLEIRDDAANGRPDWQVTQSGLYFRGATITADQPKPALAAFRFPFVAYRSGRGVYVWGRTPWGKPGQVLVEQSMPKGWKLLTRLTADRYGIFSATLRPAGNGLLLRARLPNRGWASRPFSLQVPPDLKVNPFGGTFVPCNTCPP